MRDNLRKVNEKKKGKERVRREETSTLDSSKIQEW